jgi:cytochrome b subunit of formate dehydrogenase
MHVQRYGRAARWFHAGIYMTVLVLLATGWWFIIDGYRHDSPLATMTGLADADVHELAGYGAVAVFLLWLPFGARSIGPFVRDTLRFRRGDARWLGDLPKAAFSGRFGPQQGHFDPGQRMANIMIVVTLSVLAASGLGMIYLPPIGIDLLTVHRWSTFFVTPVIVGHIVVASGILPGYRGVWRSIHLGGRLPIEVARRIWPGWVKEQDGQD